MKVTRKDCSRSTGQQANGSDVIWVRCAAHTLGGRPLAGVSICLAVACCPISGKPFSKATEILRNELAAAMIVPDPAKDLPNIITMGVLERRNLTYMPSELKVDYGAETLVTWVSEDGPFKLSFLPPVGGEGLATLTPFDEKEIDSNFNENKKLHIAQRRVRKDAGRPTGQEPVRYHYKVRLVSGGQPLEDPECPPIVVLPLPG